MQEKLAEKNPFLRDYFASQAELFHSQKVAKKLLLEGNNNNTNKRNVQM
jgi:vancomycin permeability regulator SanA